MPYFNTNNESGETLKQSKLNALTQEQFVLNIFDIHSDRSFTPFEIQKFMPDTPITSIRRAITCLTDKDLLAKTDEMRVGQYGKYTHTWKLN